MTGKTTSAVEQLNAILALEQFPPAVLVLSPDRVRRERIINILLRKFFGLKKDASSDSLPDTKSISANGLSKTDWRSLTDSLLSCSLFCTNSAVLLNNVEKISAEISKEVLEIVPTIPSQCALILSGISLPSTSVVYKFFTKKKLII